MINTYTQLTSKGKFSSSKDDENLFVNQIVSGYAEEGMGNAAASAAKVSDEWGGKQYLSLKQDAWDRLLTYYNAIS